MASDRLERGLVIVLTGIEGRSYLNERIGDGLDEGGVDWAIEIHDWTSRLGPLYNLNAQSANRTKAGEIADRIGRYRKAFPGRPVIVIGQSGGGAMAVWAAEQMKGYQKIDGLILINAALSREYRLTAAMRHTENGIVNFFSDRDWLMLGVGTTVYGTMDGEHDVSAGMKGFLIPTDLPRLYDMLYQIGWSDDMTKTGYVGSHLTSSDTDFIAGYVAPLVMAGYWNEQLIKKVAKGEFASPAKRLARSSKPQEQSPATLTPSREDCGRPDQPADKNKTNVAPETTRFSVRGEHAESHQPAR